MSTDAYTNNDVSNDHVHNHGFINRYNTIRVNTDEMQLERHGLMRHGHSMADMGHMKMHKTFTLQTKSDFLLEGIEISSMKGIILAVLFTFGSTILFDSLKLMVHTWQLQGTNPKNTTTQTRKRFCRVVAQATSHMLSISFGYIIMLCVMTMNVWLMVAVVLGSGIAHFLIRPLLLWKLGRHPEHYVEKTVEENEPLNENLDFSGPRKNHDSNKTCSLLEDNC